MCARARDSISLRVSSTGLRERLHTAMAGDGTDQRALQYEQTLVSSQSSFRSTTLRERSASNGTVHLALFILRARV